MSVISRAQCIQVRTSGKKFCYALLLPGLLFCSRVIGQIPRLSRHPAHAMKSPHDAKSPETYLRRGRHQQDAHSLTEFGRAKIYSTSTEKGVWM